MACYGRRKQVRHESQSRNKVLPERGKSHVEEEICRTNCAQIWCFKSLGLAAAALSKHEGAAVSWQRKLVWGKLGKIEQVSI